jgi:serpin B
LALSCTSQNDPILKIEDAKPIVLNAKQQIRVAQDNEFAFDLFKKTIEDSGETNVFVSPLSVSIALGMTWNGATDETKTGMEAALKMSGLSVDEINEYYKVMLTTLPGIDPTTKLNLANSIWYRLGYPVKQDFFNVNRNYFDAEVRELDFAQAWAVDTINNWCARKTNNFITDILDEIPGDAVMYLINTVYFKGIWRKQFDKKLTKEKPFTNEANSHVNVNMMYQKDTFNYTSDAYAQYLDMPYGNKAFSMTVILPNEGKDINDVLQNLSVENWYTNLNNLASQEVEVYFPRFKLKNKFLLNDVLKSMGMQRAFEDRNEFRNIADASLFISRVLHDTYIEVTEEGTEAAAVTVVELREKASLNAVVNVNRPFLFVIREQSTGVILFIGKIGNVEKH